VPFCDTDTERAVGLLRQYQANLTSPEEQALKTSVGKVSAILGSHLFQTHIMDVQLTNLLQLSDAVVLIWTKLSEDCFHNLLNRWHE
uniref:Si:dkey-31j3.11 n=1 Tax=Kryptolebias marmoratus TaxID=37003 RepID=A0A3Q2ZIV0_KRYMA